MRKIGVVVALAALLVAGCGGSSRPKGSPALIFVSAAVVVVLPWST